MTFAGNILVLISALPLIWRTIHPLFPPQYVESYAYWDAATLNSAVADGRVPQWRNMGYWTERDESFTSANEALATRLLSFSDAKLDGRTLDVGFGGGETLLLHLSKGADVVGLTTLPSDATHAQSLIAEKYPDGHAEILTGSASGHRALSTEASPYDLIYALDSAYHIPPSVLTFAQSAYSALKPDGVLAYTDVVPPSHFNSFPWRIAGMWLSLPLGVPQKNVIDRPNDLEDYKAQLERIGFVDVKIEDWSKNVWDGIADNLEKRDGVAWHAASWAFRQAGKRGWKFVAVRATRGENVRKEEERPEEADGDDGYEVHEDGVDHTEL